MKRFRNVCEFLQTAEQICPLGSHTQLQTAWKEDMRQLWFDTLGDDASIEDLEVVMDLRCAAQEAASSDVHAHTHSEKVSWQWLLTATQVEQRTESWYAEKREVLTASEIGALWKGPRTRAALVLEKASTEPPFINTRLATTRKETRATDWGIRYEPIVKQILEKELRCSISELGRIRHRNPSYKVGASPDGLITVAEDKELIGRLVEIKCPISRIIKSDTVPVDYWYQMQLQMEVCDIDVCEFVEVKFEEEKEDIPMTDVAPKAQGWITLEAHSDTFALRYIYHAEPTPPASVEPWVAVETYGWKQKELRRVQVPRDRTWFATIQEDLRKFWDDVAAARAGTFQVPEPTRKRAAKATVGASACAILDDNAEITTQTLLTLPNDIPEPPV
jgi:hypothetical protein